MASPATSQSAILRALAAAKEPALAQDTRWAICTWALLAALAFIGDDLSKEDCLVLGIFLGIRIGCMWGEP